MQRKRFLVHTCIRHWQAGSLIAQHGAWDSEFPDFHRQVAKAASQRASELGATRTQVAGVASFYRVGKTNENYSNNPGPRVF